MDQLHAVAIEVARRILSNYPSEHSIADVTGAGLHHRVFEDLVGLAEQVLREERGAGPARGRLGGISKQSMSPETLLTSVHNFH